MVPSRADTCFRATWGRVIRHSAASFSRRDLERLVISSKEPAPRWSQRKSCLARKAGSPRSFSQAASSGWVMDLMSVMDASAVWQ